MVQSLSNHWRGICLIIVLVSPSPYEPLGLLSDASTWGGGMGHKNLTVLCGGLGLAAAFVLIVAVIAAPLLQRVWSPEVVMAQR
ncbi:MAG TPA: hypothetical protein VE420_05160 [Gemmatimonadales bacterium]|nr:hypothetical protein [Gemmatimonadales bacterium]